ncbi:MAG TPA: hypothetical protein VKZ53_06100 [Candidatus Angelobacter sp.]|nr:hypothetical protein [Candidatus Angelobacter sp.]
MAAPVWSLSVDLEARTATFQSGLGDAVRSAKGAFGEIKTGAGEMSREVGHSIGEARHSVMFLVEDFGGHLPRALAGFIASLGPVGAIMEAAFPFLAITLGAKLLIEHFEKVKEAAEKLINDQAALKLAIVNSFNALDEKLLHAQIHADELSRNHLAALRHELELIDRQSMSELVHSFGEVAKAAEMVLGDLKASWWQEGSGSEGAKHALQEFKREYDVLLAQGKNEEASGLLGGTLKQAHHVLDMQNQLRASQRVVGFGKNVQEGDFNKFEEAKIELQKIGVGWTDREISAQRVLVEALDAQAAAQSRIAEIRKLEQSNTSRETGKKINAEEGQKNWKQAESERHEQELLDKEREEAFRNAVARLTENEREKIDATEKGSAERLSAIDAAIKEENTRGLQEAEFYKSLLRSRIETVRDMATEQARIQAELGKEAATHTLKMNELQLAADKDAAQLRRSTHRATEAEITRDEITAANGQFQIRAAALAQEIAALDKHGKDYEVKLQALENRKAELIRQHENEITHIRDQAEEQRSARIIAAQTKIQGAIASGLASVIQRHESFAHMIASLGDQVVSSMLQTAIKSVLALNFSKEREAAAAGRAAFLNGMKFPFPANIVAAPTLAASAFATVMQFQTGGIVPGVGVGDVVPARLEPGEAVIDKRLTEGLQNAARSGSLGGQPSVTHVHAHFAPVINAIDAEGVGEMLQKHGEQFHQHFERRLRRLNR